MIYCECSDELVRFLANFAEKKNFKVVIGYGCSSNTKFTKFAIINTNNVYMTVEITNPSYSKKPWLVILDKLNKGYKKR